MEHFGLNLTCHISDISRFNLAKNYFNKLQQYMFKSI